MEQNSCLMKMEVEEKIEPVTQFLLSAPACKEEDQWAKWVLFVSLECRQGRQAVVDGGKFNTFKWGSSL